MRRDIDFSDINQQNIHRLLKASPTMADKVKIIDLLRAKKDVSANQDWEDRAQKYKPTIQKFIGKLKEAINVRKMYGEIINDIELGTKKFAHQDRSDQIDRSA